MSNRPTPSQMLVAFNDHGVDYKTYKGWDTRGGAWGAYGGGLDGIILHHTSTPSATGPSGCPTLYWCAETYDWAISNVVLGRGKGDTYFLSAKPSYHSGDGGPWPDIGINQSGNIGHHQLFGIEIDDAGRGLTLTDYQIENAARIAAALWDLCGWPSDKRIITHQAWTDGSYGVNPKGPSPFLGRKGDTLHKEWAEYPGSTKAENYNPIFWREEAKKYLLSNQTPTWDGTIPRRSFAKIAFDDRNIANKATWRMACKLYDMRFRDKESKTNGEQRYPIDAVKAFQTSVGITANGEPTAETWIKLFGKNKP